MEIVPLYPITERWDLPKPPWYAHYPPGTPPGLEYPKLRAERLLEIAADHFPKRDALRFLRTRWTYEELLGRVRVVANNLAKFGVGPGERVLLVLPNAPETVAVWFAAHYLGAEIVHGSPLNSNKEIDFLVRATRPRVAVGLDLRMETLVEASRNHSIPHLFWTSVAPHLPPHLRALYSVKKWMNGTIRVGRQSQLHPFAKLYRGSPMTSPATDDHSAIAVLQPTGGTTGVPKLAMLTHSNIVSNVAQGAAMQGGTPGQETTLAVLPFFHIYGATAVMLGCLAAGVTMIVHPRFDLQSILDSMVKERVTIAPLVPFMYSAMVEELEKRPRKFPDLRICVSGASALSSTLLKKFQDLTGIEILEGYGLSEASPVSHVNPPGRPRVGTIGVPVIDTDVRIVDVENGLSEVGAGEVGELVIRGPQIMKGYLDNPEETDIALRDGWLYTGDVATREEDYYYRIVDRKKDMIISGGLNVFPSEIEALIHKHPNVDQCAVVGEANERWGERVVAYIVPKPGKAIDEESMKAFCKESLSGYKVPREFKVCDELPRNFLGKVRRVALRNNSNSPAPAPTPPVEAT